MNIVASFTGRGIDVHKDLYAQSNQAYSLLMNLRDGIDSGRVRWFLVAAEGADVFGDLADALEKREITWQDVSRAVSPPDVALDGLDRMLDVPVNMVNALHADGDHEAAADQEEQS